MNSAWERNFEYVEVDSSNATASDIPGPGRILGKVYKKLGKPIERVLNKLAVQTGPNPDVFAVRIRGRTGRVEANPEASYVNYDFTESSNATTNDLPGPGRNLGNMYKLLGRQVELLINTLARRSGSGPEKVAMKIRRRFEQLEMVADKEAIHQEKDLKKLIRYTTSKLDSTRRQAFNEIINLAFEYEQLLDFLRSVRAAETIQRQQAYIWDFCDTSLQVSARMALACVQGEKIYKLIMGCLQDSGPLLAFIRQDPGELFLVLRMLNHRLALGKSSVWGGATEEILDGVIDQKVTWSHVIDWDEIDLLYKYWIGFRLDDGGGDYIEFNDYEADALWTMLQLHEKLPQTFQSDHFCRWKQDLESVGKPASHSVLNQVVIRVMDLEKFLYSLRRHVFPFLNIADIAFSYIAHEWGVEDNEYATDGSGCVAQCQLLAQFCDSDDQHLKSRALLCVGRVLSRDIRSREAMVSSLNTSKLKSTSEYPVIIESTRSILSNQLNWCRFSDSDFSHLHRDDDDCPIHFTNEDQSGIKRGIPGCEECSIEYACECSPQSLLWYPTKTPVHLPDEVVPVLVGECSDGRNGYLARTEPYDPFDFLLKSDERIPRHERVYVAVLRNTPAERDRFLRESGAGDCSSTSDLPYIWTPVREVSFVQEETSEEETSEEYTTEEETGEEETSEDESCEEEIEGSIHVEDNDE